MNRKRQFARYALVLMSLSFIRSHPIVLAQAHGALKFYVASDGNDSWSGRLQYPNQSHSDGPLATLVAARNAVRKARLAGGVDVSVIVEKGVYALPEPLWCSVEDSGTEAHPVVWEAAPGDHAVLSSGESLC